MNENRDLRPLDVGVVSVLGGVTLAIFADAGVLAALLMGGLVVAEALWLIQNSGLGGLFIGILVLFALGSICFMTDAVTGTVHPTPGLEFHCLKFLFDFFGP
jgi:hypothetical protein